ncbi:MAG: DMT family transporter [Rhodospirillales bacterium]
MAPSTSEKNATAGAPRPGKDASGAASMALTALLCGAVGIAFAPIFVRLSELGPSATAFHRVLLALPVLWAWGAMERRGGMNVRRPAGLADYMALALAGLFFGFDLAFWHWSIRYTTVANSTLLANFAPIFVTLAGFVFFKERFSRLFLLGLVMAIGGASVLMGKSFTIGPANLLGDGLGLITAVFYAGYIITVGRLRARFSTATIMVWSSLVSAFVLLGVALISGEGLVAPSLYGWAVLLGLAVLSHCGGQGLIAYSLAHLPAAFSSVALLLQPAVAAGLAWIILDEALGGWQALGAAVILAGIYLAHRGSRIKAM